MAKTDPPEYTLRQDLDRTIHWDRAYQSDEGYYFVPLTLSLKVESEERFQNGRKVYPYKTVLMIDPTKDEGRYTMLTFVGEGSVAAEFTGMMLFEDYFLGNVKYTSYQDGVTVHFRNGNIESSDLKMFQASGGGGCGWIEVGEICVGDMDGSGAPDSCESRYEYACNGDAPIDFEDAFDGGGGGENNGGNGGGGYSGNGNSIREINNEIVDPCLMNTVAQAINNSYSMMGTIANIISQLDSRTDVKIRVIDGNTTNGKPGQITNQNLIFTVPDNTPKEYMATIILDQQYMIETSKEGVIAVLIHEILHGYITESNLRGRRNELNSNELQHEIFASEYVEPMAEFLLNLFPTLPAVDAHALAWSGLQDQLVFESIMIDNVQYSKADLIYNSSRYYGKFNGEHLAGTDKCIE